ncbi:hypothetical protein Y032_0141g2250 [Ancylostoma ceylanicum]|uniref:Uncharacterized protein n=1 Tax=Ancylostoma ceylanicum TaxID=53326 RepID=A0A016T480_9BILA|nr:hypothetical protein Y032_0141g2250 [Ancylostoma ceylanicum]
MGLISLPSTQIRSILRRGACERVEITEISYIHIAVFLKPFDRIWVTKRSINKPAYNGYLLSKPAFQ